MSTRVFSHCAESLVAVRGPQAASDWAVPELATAAGRTGTLSTKHMGQADVYRMIGRRALNADVQTRIGCNSFRAIAIPEYFSNGGKLEVAQQMANHESARTTGLYDWS